MFTASNSPATIAEEETLPTGNGDVTHHAPPLQVISETVLPSQLLTSNVSLQQIRQSSKESTGSSDTDSSSDDESGIGGVSAAPLVQTGIVQPDKVAQTKETEAGAEISALVNYVQPVHFSSFENSESKCQKHPP